MPFLLGLIIGAIAGHLATKYQDKVIKFYEDKTSKTKDEGKK